MQKLLETIIQGDISFCIIETSIIFVFFLNYDSCCLLTRFISFTCGKMILVRAVDLVSLLKSNLISMGEYQEQLLELTFLRDHVFVKYLIPRETTIVFIFFVLHHLRSVVSLSSVSLCHDIFSYEGKSNWDLSLPLFCLWQVTEKYKLGHPKSFHYLNQSNCYELVGVNDAHEYLATKRAMDIVGINEQEQVF